MAAMALLLALCLLASHSSSTALAQSSIMSQLQSSDFTGFLKLLEDADMVPEIESVIASGRPVTLLCPNDDALLTSTSPTLLAFLRLAENKAVLKKVLRAHILPGRLSPFQWEGAHETLEPTAPLALAMDSHAFYANNVAVSRYNALVSPEASVHSIPMLILPPGVSTGGAKALVEESTALRRVLAETPGPAPVGGATVMGTMPPPSAGPAQAVASMVTVVAALALALML